VVLELVPDLTHLTDVKPNLVVSLRSISLLSITNASGVENDQASARPIASDEVDLPTTARQILKVLRDPRLAAALFNAQFSMRGKARVPLSVRLFGRVYFRPGGYVEFGNGVALVGNVTPIEIVSYKGSHISVGDHTFINYGASITAYQNVSIGRHCLLGHHVRIVDRNEHGVEQRELAQPAQPVVIEDHVWIGSHTIILPGVSIGHNSAIGAGSVVTRDVPANCLAAGNPARILRRI
jgi:acetyltransferase-like isoleucine patch superfamily enzyme